MKTSTHIEISKDILDKILSYFPSKKYKVQSHLFYEGQIPISGFLIINGAIKISNKKKYSKILSTGTIIGIDEYIHKKPISLTAEVYPNTEICFIDKATLMELLKHTNNEIAQYFKKLCGLKNE